EGFYIVLEVEIIKKNIGLAFAEIHPEGFFIDEFIVMQTSHTHKRIGNQIFGQSNDFIGNDALLFISDMELDKRIGEEELSEVICCLPIFLFFNAICEFLRGT